MHRRKCGDCDFNCGLGDHLLDHLGSDLFYLRWSATTPPWQAIFCNLHRRQLDLLGL
jgi:hypothetical protein